MQSLAPPRCLPLLALFIIVSACTRDSVAQLDPDLSPERLAAVDAHFARYDGARPGYAVGIVAGGELVHARGFGQANLSHGLPITPDTVFNIASLSKQVTAAALGLLIVDGDVALDSPVAAYIAEWPEAFAAVEVQHLVYMTSGVPEYYTLERPDGRDWQLDYFTVDDALSVVMAQPALEFTPGSRWAYNNSNYQLIAEIVERVSGMPFSEFVRIRMFEPLGMHDSLVNDDLATVIARRATGYNVDNDSYRREIRRAPHYGGSGVFSTVRDLARWSMAYESHALGSQELTELLLSTRRFDHDKTNDAFGLVWGEYRGQRTLWYEGGDLGFSSYMVRVPDSGLTIIVLSNLGTGNAAREARAVLDLLFASD